MKMGEKRESKAEIAVWIAYYLSIGIFSIGAIFPDGRVWGINWWSVLPVWGVCLLIAILAVLPVLLMRLSIPIDSATKVTSALPTWTLIALPILSGLAFYLFMTETHFGGDGYALLASSPGGVPWEKGWRQIGEHLVHNWFGQMLNDRVDDPVVASYRIVSISAGVLAVVVCVWSAIAMFRDRSRQLTFLASVMSAGFALLFFGYVENYSLFAVFVLGYTIVGFSIADHRARFSYILPLLAACVFFHVLGVFLIPATVYLFVERGGESSGRQHRKLIALAIVICLAAAVTFSYFSSLFVRLAFLSPVMDAFATDSYTLFAPAHILDYANLVALLIPSFLVIAVVLVWKRPQGVPLAYLAILAVTCLWGAFVIDPKLGMARDWDLFAFVSVTTAVAGGLFLLRSGLKYGIQIALACIVLNFSVLVPRVVVANSAQLAEKRFTDYLDLAGQRGRTGHKVLIDYYLRLGEIDKADSVKAVRLARFPEISWVLEAIEMRSRSKLDSAKVLLEKAIKANPRDFNAWANLGEIYVQRKNYDTAISIYRISQGLNPGNASILNNLAYAYYYLDDHAQAEALWLEAIRNDTTKIEPLLGMAQLKYVQGDLQTYERYFVRVIKNKDAPLEYVRSAIDYWASWENWELARNAFVRAQRLGMDSAAVRAYLVKYPILGEVY